MIRLAFALAIVAAIYMHSPQRPEEGVERHVSEWVDLAKAKIATSAAGTNAASLLAGAALRQTLDMTGASAPQPPAETRHGPTGHAPIRHP